MLLNELTDGAEIDQVLLVREAERRQRRDGGEYLRLQLGDRTGAVACMVWEELAEVEELARAGAPVQRARPLHRASALRPADQPARPATRPEPGSFDPEDLLDGPAREVEQMEARAARAARDDPAAAPARSCSSACSARTRSCGPATAWRRRRSTTTRPTATGCSSTASASPRRSARSARRSPGIDRDVAVTGALLHDIGKLEAYTDDRASRHRPHRRRAAARRDRARLLPHPPRDRGHRGLPARSSRRRSGTSSSPTTARSSTAARWCRARARRRSCT